MQLKILFCFISSLWSVSFCTVILKWGMKLKLERNYNKLCEIAPAIYPFISVVLMANVLILALRTNSAQKSQYSSKVWLEVLQFESISLWQFWNFLCIYPLFSDKPALSSTFLTLNSKSQMKTSHHLSLNQLTKVSSLNPF